MGGTNSNYGHLGPIVIGTDMIQHAKKNRQYRLVPTAEYANRRIADLDRHEIIDYLPFHTSTPTVALLE